MVDFEVAHLKIQGVDVVIVFIGSDFDHKSSREQSEVQAVLQLCSQRAGLAGNVVLVWRDALGNFKFMAPRNQHPYFSTADLFQLYRQVNKRLSCG